jgi:ribonuclease HI
MKRKFYAVRAGKETGIFSSWEECKVLVYGFAGAEFKSFTNKQSAEHYMKYGRKCENENNAPAEGIAAYVDGSFRDGVSSYGCVILKDGVVVEELSGSDDSFPESRNIYGEVLGVQKAVEWGIANGHAAMAIYYDYSGIEKWATSDWRANSHVSRKYKAYMDKISERVTVSFKKVTAHSGDFFNERADKLARGALPKRDSDSAAEEKKQMRKDDLPY